MGMLGAGGGKNIVEIIIAAKDTTSKAFTKVQTQMKGLKGAASKMGATMKSVGGKIKGLMGSIGPLIGIAGIAGIALALKGAITTFGKFEQAAANAASVTGKTGQAFQDTRQHIMAVSKVLGETTVFTASQAADAFYDLASAGYDVAKITKNELKPVLDLAAATQSDLKATTEVVTSTLGQFGLTMKNSKDVADIFARTIGSSKATLEKLGISLAYVGPVAHSLGMSLEETNGILGILYNTGYDASMAGTALRGAFTRLLTPTSAAKDIFARLGVTMADVNPEANSMADILSTLNDAGMDTADAMEIFGRRAGPAMLALTGSTDDIRTLTVELQNAGGAAAIMAEQQLATFEGRMALVKSKLEATAIALGSKLSPALVAAANGLTDKVIPAFQEFGESLRNQLTPAFGPLKEKMGDAFDKMSGGITLMERLDAAGVILGAMLKPLADAFGWLIEKLGPLWDLLGMLSEATHVLANALRTEEGHIDNIKDAVDELNKSKENLILLNEKLNIKTAKLASELEKAGWPMEKLNELEKIAIEKTEELAAARIKATEALATKDLDAYNLAMEDVTRLEDEAKTATENLNSEVSATAKTMIDAGTATDDLKVAYSETNKVVDDLSEEMIILEKNVGKADKAMKASTDTMFEVAKAHSGWELFSPEGMRKYQEELDKVLESTKETTGKLPNYWTESVNQINAVISGYEKAWAGATEEQKAEITKQVKALYDMREKYGLFATGVMGFFDKIEEKVIDVNKNIDGSTLDATDNIMGYWDESIKQISAAIVELKKEYAEASEERKKEIRLEAEELYKLQKEYKDLADGVHDDFDEIEASIKTGTDAITDFGGKTKKSFSEVSIEIGNTEVTFKGLASEVAKNVDSFEDLQKTAQTLIDMNWQVFRDLEDVLPEISAGIGNMESAFAGLEVVLKDNLTKLESVKESIESIGDMIGPYIEKGFLDGIKAIGDFAGALSDAGNAINTFGSLTEANVEGCIKFSTNIHGMVSALKVLDSQMADLMPSFGDMNSLIGSISDTFVWSGGKSETMADKFSTAFKAIKDDMAAAGVTSEEFSTLFDELRNRYWYWSESAFSSFIITKPSDGLAATLGLDREAFLDLYRVMDEIEGKDYHKHWTMIAAAIGLTDEEAKKMADDMIHGGKAVEYQLNKQTDALKSQTEQLNKITEALQPLLNFLDTLNKIAALSAISQDELNTAFKNILDTLTNLGVALNNIDFEMPITNLVKDSESFRTTMEKNTAPLDQLNFYVGLLTDTILGLVQAFEALGSIEESVLKDTDKLEEIFISITTITDNLTEALKDTAEGGKGFADQFATGFKDMLSAAAPLIGYFRENQAAVIEFNNTLGLFMTTVSHAVNVIESLKEVSIDISATEIVKSMEEIEEAIKQFTWGLVEFATEGGDIGYYLDLLSVAWGKFYENIEDTLPALKESISMFDSLISPIEKLSRVMINLEETTAFTHDTVVNTLEKIEEAIKQFTWGLVEFATEGGDIGYYLDLLSVAWERWYKDMEDSIPVLGNAANTFNTLTSSIVSLISGFTSLKDTTELTFTDFDDGMKKITRTIPRFTRALEINMDAIVQVLTDLDTVWSKYAEDMKDIIPSASGAANAFTTLTSSVLALSGAFTKLMEFGEMSEANFDAGLQKLMRTFDNFAKSLDKNIEALMASLHGLVTEWLENEDQMVYLMRAFVTIAGNFITVISYALRLADAFDALKGKTGIIKSGFDDLIGVIDHLMAGLEGMYSTDVEKDLDSFITKIGDIISALTNLKTTLNVDVAAAFNNLASAIPSDETAYGWGHSLMYNFVEGIYSETEALRTAMASMASIVDSYMGVSSNTKLGALSHLEDFGPNLVRTFSEGIREGLPNLNKTLTGLSLGDVSLNAGMAGGGSSVKNVYMTVNQNINNREDARFAVAEIERIMRKPAIL